MTRRWTTRCLALAASLGLLATLTGCSGGRDALTIYSGRTENLVGPLLQQFHEQTGIAIDVKYGDSAELALLIETEGERSRADVFLSQTPGANAFLADLDLLAVLPERTQEQVDERFRDPGGHWLGVTGRQRVLVYNQNLIQPSELPSTIDEVIEPEFAGKVAVAPTNGSFQDFVTAMRQVRGDAAAKAWLTELAQSGAPTYPNNNAIVDAVSRGEVPMGLVNHYYNVRFLQEDPKLPSRNHALDGDDVGSLLIPSTVSVLKNSPRADAAQRFVEFLLSAEAQRYFADETYEYPLAHGVQPAADLPPLRTLQAFPYRFEELGGGLEATVEIIRESGLGAG